MAATAEIAAWPPPVAEAIRGLGRDYFEERSVKFVAGAVERDRILLGVSAEPALRRHHLGIARSLGLDGGALDELDLRLCDAHMIHFGQEGRGPDAVRKVYLEFPAPPPDLPRVRFLAWKIRSGAPLVRSVYRLAGDATSTGLIGALAGFQLGDEVAGAARAVLERAAERSGWSSPVLLSVSEPGTPRRSFDLNVYDAGLTIGEVTPDLRQALATLGAATASFPPETRLGHVSGGTGRHGEPFLTLYAGARLVVGPA
jgi:hypothetical protein